VDGLHLSFTEQSFGRNFLEVSLELGSTGKKKFQPVELIGQVEWYERRSTVAGHAFIVGVGFVDPQADAMIILREFLQTAHLLAR
jgi:hypothetical protein